MGLLLIVICGADLYTGNTCSLFTANIEGKANLWHDIKHLFSAYFWNLVGALIIIGFEVRATSQCRGSAIAVLLSAGCWMDALLVCCLAASEH